MSFLFKLIVHISANAAAILAADRLIPGFIFRGDWPDLAIAGITLGLVNSFIRPIIKLIAFPIILLTFGIFTVIINIAMLLITARLLDSLSINSLWAAVWGVLIISLVNHIILSVFKDKKISP